MTKVNEVKEVAPNFQIFKKGKPFTKLSTNDQTPRMTRENYFKLAESQGLVTMREEMISILNQTDNELNMSTHRSNFNISKASKGGAAVGKAAEGRTSSNFVSVAQMEKKSEASS